MHGAVSREPQADSGSRTVTRFASGGKASPFAIDDCRLTIDGRSKGAATRVGFRLPPELAAATLKKPGFEPFAPRGKRMAAWVMSRPKRAGGLRRLAPLFRESLDFVSGLGARAKPSSRRAL